MLVFPDQSSTEKRTAKSGKTPTLRLPSCSPTQPESGTGVARRGAARRQHRTGLNSTRPNLALLNHSRVLHDSGRSQCKVRNPRGRTTDYRPPLWRCMNRAADNHRARDPDGWGGGVGVCCATQTRTRRFYVAVGQGQACRLTLPTEGKANAHVPRDRVYKPSLQRPYDGCERCRWRYRRSRSRGRGRLLHH